ncbi:MAG: hypothetical protein HZB79_04370 [Deltaproteobacteria bacterium]|nr:hypothetical protein [Deltaproteobacteria bacterium]
MGIMMGIMVIAMAAGFSMFGHHKEMITNHDEMLKKEEQIMHEDKNEKENSSIEEKEK